MAYRFVFHYSTLGVNPMTAFVDTAAAEHRAAVNAALPKTFVPLGGKMYFAVGNTVRVYDPADGSVTTLGTVADTTIYCGTTSSDGKVVFGTHPQGRAVLLDPVTGTLTDYGRTDVDGGTQYAYSIGADAGYIYVGLGQDPWYLGIVNRSTGEKTLYYKDSELDAVNVARAVDGTLWYGTDKLIGGAPVAGQQKPAEVPWYEQSGANIDATTWAARIGYEVDLDEADAYTNKPPVIRWRAVGAQDWTEYAPQNVPLTPQTIFRVYPYDANRVLCLSNGYGPVYLYNTTTKAVEVLGSPQRSLYAASKIGTKWYLSGYPAATYEYDPAQPWTLSKSSADHSTTNPRAVAPFSKYHEFSVAGSDGRLYVGVRHERDSVGGEMGWYDPSDDSTGSVRDPLAAWSPRGLVAVGDRIVWSGNSLEGDPGTLFVFNVSDPATVERTIQPHSDLAYTSAGCIVAVSETDVIGLSGVRAYRVNVVTGAEVWRVTLPGDVMADVGYRNRQAEVAPDGNLYFYIGADVYRLVPSVGALTRVCDGGAQGVIMWHGARAFVYTTTRLRELVIV